MAKTSTVDQSTGEIVDQDQSTAVALFNASGLKLKRRVTMPALLQRVGLPNYVYFLSDFYFGEKIDAPGAKIKEVPTMAKVLNLEDNQVYVMIMRTVPLKELKRAYPDGGHVGKAFMLELHNAGEGKDYKLCNIAEIELPEGFTPPSI